MNSIAFYCPLLCGKCQMTTTKPTTTTLKPCIEVQCQNDGQFNLKTCSCVCFAAYKGSFCETLMCDKEPKECSAFTLSQCNESSFSSYCPILCGKCETTTITTTTTTVTTTTIMTTTTSNCILSPCINGGSFNIGTCSCNCMPAYTGIFCENLICENEPIECINFKADQCSMDLFNYYCPVLCGVCNASQLLKTTSRTTETTTTNSIPTATTCRTIKCENEGNFNSSTCKCTCLPTWSGQFCEIPACENEPESCQLSTDLSLCSNSIFRSVCPKLCGICKECTPLDCKYGGTFNSETCKCNCFFSEGPSKILKSFLIS